MIFCVSVLFRETAQDAAQPSQVEPSPCEGKHFRKLNRIYSTSARIEEWGWVERMGECSYDQEGHLAIARRSACLCLRLCLCVYVCVCVCIWGFSVCDLMFTESKGCGKAINTRHGLLKCSSAQVRARMKDDASSQQQQRQPQQQQVISINLMAFHLQPKLNRLFAVKNFELRRER